MERQARGREKGDLQYAGERESAEQPFNRPERWGWQPAHRVAQLQRHYISGSPCVRRRQQARRYMESDDPGSNMESRPDIIIIEERPVLASHHEILWLFG